MSLPTKQKQTHRTDLWLPRGRGCGGRMDWEFGVSSTSCYIYVQLNHLVVYQKLTQHCKSTINKINIF